MSRWLVLIVLLISLAGLTVRQSDQMSTRPLLVKLGAAPNAIAYNSGQFTSGEFFKYGIPASILLLIVVGIFVRFVWPLMGMPVLLK